MAAFSSAVGDGALGGGERSRRWARVGERLRLRRRGGEGERL